MQQRVQCTRIVQGSSNNKLPRCGTEKRACHTWIQFGGVYSWQLGQCTEVGGTLHDKYTTNPALRLRPISVRSGMFLDVFFQNWSKQEFQSSWVARFLVSTGGTQTPILFTKLSRGLFARNVRLDHRHLGVVAVSYTHLDVYKRQL